MDSTMVFGVLAFIPVFIITIVMASFAQVKAWSPFKIDALGIVTLLGADDVRKVLGRLVYSPFEYFPLLAGHIFADNSVTDPVPGFVLYNATEGMMATDLNAWFTRWLLCRKVQYCTTQLDIRVVEKVPHDPTKWPIGTISAVLLNTFLIVWPILLHDWYGFTTSLSLVFMVLVRVYVLWDCRASIDKQTKKAEDPTKMKEVKLFITLPTGSRITVKTTTGIVQDCLLTEARPRNTRAYMVARTLCWLAFGIHAVSLGMACLAVQIVLITVTLACSVAAIQGWYSDGVNMKEALMGNHLLIKQHDFDGKQRMGKIYALQEYTDVEEQNMVDWALFPKRTNQGWWSTYETFKNDAKDNPAVVEEWGDRLKAGEDAEQLLLEQRAEVAAEQQN